MLLQLGTGKKHRRPKQRNGATGLGKGLVKLGQGVGEGVYDFFSLPVRRARSAENTTAGAFAGLGQGVLSLVCKPVAGMCYFFYCPYDGIKRSVKNAGVRSQTVYYARHVY